MKTKADHAAYMRRWRLTSPKYTERLEKRREYNRRWHSEHQTEITFYQRHKNYGLTLDQYHSLAEKQDFLCAVCLNEPTRGGRHKPDSDCFAVDHDHTTGKVRGLLCDMCNRAIGMLRENVSSTLNLAAYLQFHQAEQVK